MAPLRRVPWYSSLEWMDVFNGVFSDEDVKRDAAIARFFVQISLWEVKSPRVPVAVSITRLLLEALKADREDTRSTTELQLLYSGAIIRFVNAHVDIQQNKLYVQSIAGIAQSIGIPAEVVDCRHRITHQSMPTLQLLRHTAAICFDYVRTNYWLPQAESVKSRLASLNQSKYLASGLVALVQDLDELNAPDNLENSLKQLLLDVTSQDGEEWSVRTLLLAAADVAGLKQKDAMRFLRRMGLPEVSRTIDEYLFTSSSSSQCFSQPAFVAASNWCQRLRIALPKCVEFLESILYQCPHESITLSFMKDFVFIVFDADSNVGALLAVIWAIGRSSPNMVNRLITRLVNSVIDGPKECQFDLPSSDATGSSDYKCFTRTDTTTTTIDNKEGISGACFDSESFTLWLKAMDVPSEEELHLKEDLEKFGLSPNTSCLHKFLIADTTPDQERLLGWLRCLLLLPPLSSQHESSELQQLPVCIELLLHLFCDPIVSSASTSSKSLSSVSPLSSTSRHVFCNRFLQCVNVCHSRVLSACRASLRSVAWVACRTLVAESSDSQRERDNNCGLKALVRVFDEADVRIPNGAASRLIEWIQARLSRRAPSSELLRHNRQSLQRLLAPLERQMADAIGQKSLMQQFKTVLGNLMQQSSSGHLLSGEADGNNNVQKPILENYTQVDAQRVKSHLSSLREAAATFRDTSIIREECTLDVPWTTPGTVPVEAQNGQIRLVNMVPVSGGSLSDQTIPMTAVLQNVPDSVIRQAKRPQRENDDEGENQFLSSVQPPSVKRLKKTNTDVSIERFIYSKDGYTIPDHHMTGGHRVVPTAIQELENKIIQSQQHQNKPNYKSLISDWTNLQNAFQ